MLHADSTEKTSDEKDEKEENIEPVHSGKRILLIVEDNLSLIHISRWYCGGKSRKSRIAPVYIIECTWQE